MRVDTFKKDIFSLYYMLLWFPFKLSTIILKAYSLITCKNSPSLTPKRRALTLAWSLISPPAAVINTSYDHVQCLT